MKRKCVKTYSDKQERKSKSKKLVWEESALEEHHALQPGTGALIHPATQKGEMSRVRKHWSLTVREHKVI